MKLHLQICRVHDFNAAITGPSVCNRENFADECFSHGLLLIIALKYVTLLCNETICFETW